MKKFFNKKLILISLSLLIILLGTMIGYRLSERFKITKYIKDKVIIEYGTPISLEDILVGDYQKYNIYIKEDLNTIKEVGKYKITLIINNYLFYIDIIIKDTTPPTLEVKDLTTYIDEELPSTSSFIDRLNDLSKITLEDLNLKKELGIQEVTIIAKDEYGNKTIKKATLTIKEDKEPPKFSGLDEIIIFTGDKPDLNKDVFAYDERFGNVTFTYDDSQVNYHTKGVYQIYYQAEDKLGNIAKETRQITVKQRDITYMIESFPTYSQFPNYPNGCESVALYTLLKYHNVSISVDDIIDKLKKGSGPYLLDGILYGGNPEIEFVGDPREWNGYGVYQKPIIEVANYYKEGIIDYTGHSLNEVLNLVKNKKPVQVWVSINLQDTSVSKNWIYQETGEKISWIRNLHSVVITGFNSSYIYVSDPYTGVIKKYNRYQFEKIYNLFGKRAIYYEN